MKKKLIVVLLSLFIVFSVFSGGDKETTTEDTGGYIAAPTVSYAMGITTEFPQQLELVDYEKQTGEKLEFTGNPLFAEREKSKDLPSVDQRLPEEPLVVLPYDVIGKYGGQLKGMCISYESGTSEVMAWRHANLVRFSDDMSTLVPNVAKAWKWNSDFTEITFTLRKGHKWSDGDPFDADDMVFYVNDILLNKEIHKVIPSPWSGAVPSIEKINDVTVKMKFENAFTGLLYYLGGSGSYFDAFAPKHFLEQYHIEYNANADKEAKAAGYDNWVQQFGTYWNKWKDAVVAGPEGVKVPTLESHILQEVPTTQRRIYIANPYYFKVDTAGNQLPYVDYHYERFLEKQLWPLEIMNGNIDQKAQNMPLDIYTVLKENEKKGQYELQLPSGQVGPTMIFNQTSDDPVLGKIFSDVRFRYAMSLAINRNEINESLFLGLGTPEQALPLNVPYVTDKDRKFMTEYNPDKANKLLDEMGLKMGSDGYRMGPDGKPFTVLWEYTLQYVWTTDFPALVSEYWKDVGVKVLLKEVTTQLTRDKQKANTLDITSEWMAPFEPSMISTPHLFLPPYSGHWPIMGLPWMDWKTSNGSSGVKPPAWVLDLWDIAAEWTTLVPGSSRYIELGKKIIKINQENLPVIGTLGNIPLITVVSDRLGNAPEWTINSTFFGYSYPYRADQWFIK